MAGVGGWGGTELWQVSRVSWRKGLGFGSGVSITYWG